MPIKDPQVQLVWQLVYDLLHGPGRSQTFNSFLALQPKFDEGLLNDIAAISSAETSEKAQTIEKVRAKVSICSTTGLFGEKDLERINQELDKINLGEAYGTGRYRS